MSESKRRIEVAEQWDYKAVEYETPSPNDYRIVNYTLKMHLKMLLLHQVPHHQ